MGHGHAPVTPVEKGPVNAQLAETGRALVGVDGGFSCVACHRVKNRDPLRVFEAQGVNFSRVDERLHLNISCAGCLILRVDPQTRMPDYFDDDARSVLVDVLVTPETDQSHPPISTPGQGHEDSKSCNKGGPDRNFYNETD